MPELSSTQLSELFQGRFSCVEDRDEAKKMWSIYTEEVNKYDESVTTAQRDDANSVLVFTGLFSAIVAVFVVESYKKLSPDSGDKTTVLLEQISGQLAGFQNNTYPPSQGSPSFSPSGAILWVNVLWFLSLVVSMASAFYVMLVQQWVRRYTQMVQDLSGDDGPVRSSLFLGTQKYRMSHAIGLIPLPLHISVFLFLSGLIIFLFTISHTVATAISVCVGVFGLAYFILTILPTIDDACPYFTPLSDVWWHLWHTSLSTTALCLRWLVRRLRDRLVQQKLGEMWSPREHKLVKWSKMFESTIKEHKQHLKDGLRGSIVRRAINAPESVDFKAITWLLQRPTMAEKGNIQDLIANIRGVTLIQLMNSPEDSGRNTFREHLFALLRSCSTPGTAGLDKNVRNRRLLVCLNVLHHIAKALFVPYEILPSPALLNDVLVNFASIEAMRILWADSDPAIRVTSRSICALLAKYLLLHQHHREGSELAWLENVMGQPLNASIDSLVAIDHVNLKSYVYGVLSNQTNDLPPKHATAFAETLAILMNAGGPAALSRDIFEEQLFAFIQKTENDDHQHHDDVVTRLRDMFRSLLADAH